MTDPANKQIEERPCASAKDFIRVLPDGSYRVAKPSDKPVTWDPRKVRPNPNAAYGIYDPYRIMDEKEWEAMPEARKQHEEEMQRRAAARAKEEELKKKALQAAAKAKRMKLTPSQATLPFSSHSKDSRNTADIKKDKEQHTPATNKQTE